MKKNGIERALEYGKSLRKELSPKIHYLAGYNQAVEDYNSIEADAIQDFLSTEIMVLREKNAELVEMLESTMDLLEAYPSESEMHLKATEIRELIKLATYVMIPYLSPCLTVQIES